MERKFELIENENLKKGKKESFLIKKQLLEHIENEKTKLIYFQSTERYSKFTFEYKEENAIWKIPFEIEYVIDTLIVDFEGKDLPDPIRMVASKLLKEIISSIRFMHKDKYWSLSYYFLDDIKHYKKRLTKEFLIELEGEWKKIKRLAELEAMDDDDYLFFKTEDVHDLSLWVAGEDGRLLCEYLEELKLITFQQSGLNRYEIQLTGKKEDIKIVNEKIVFAREIAKYGYNIWTDYVE